MIGERVQTELPQQLRELFRLGPQPPVALSGDVITVVNAITLDDSPYHGKRGVSVAFDISASAADRSYISIGLDADAGLYARLVVRRIVVAAAGASAYYLELAAGADQSGSDFGALDWDQSIAGITNKPPVQCWYGGTGNALVPANRMGGGIAPGSYTPSELIGPFIVGPGGHLRCILSNTNIAAFITCVADIYGL